MSGFYVRGLPEERIQQVREQASVNLRDMRDEAAILIVEALDARSKRQAEKRERLNLVAAAS